MDIQEIISKHGVKGLAVTSLFSLLQILISDSHNIVNLIPDEQLFGIRLKDIFSITIAIIIIGIAILIIRISVDIYNTDKKLHKTQPKQPHPSVPS